MTKNCPHCNGNLDIRNPTGKCDHLHYPSYCDECKSKGYSYYEIVWGKLE